MKKIFISLLIVAATISSCKKDFLNSPNPNSVDISALSNKVGVDQLLIGAYHNLSGLTPKSQWWSTSGTNWVYGDITSGDCYRGGTSDPDDAITVEHFQGQPSTRFFADKWRTVYDGVSRSNAVIKAASAATDMTDEQKKIAIAQARLLRGHFHFEAKKMWKYVPYIDENVTDFGVSNRDSTWPLIESDFRFAYENLPVVMPSKGQVNKWTAASYLAKSYMFQRYYDSAKTILDQIIPAAYGGSGNGATAQGESYALMPNFYDNFDADKENNAEHILQVNFSVNDGSDGANSNIGESGNTPSFEGISSFGTTWKQPSFNLVNAFKTTTLGLPMLDTFNSTNMKNDQDIAADDYTYSTYQESVDPRLDWTVSRRGVPFLDWENYTGYSSNPGSDVNTGWVNDRSFGGPYLPVKNQFRADQMDKFREFYGQGYLLTSATNYSIIRFADVLLWAAECEVELNNLDRARTLINYVRERAKTGGTVPVVYDYIGNNEASATYFVDTYNTAFADQVTARKAVRFERRLELALEGHRFFDLVRWNMAADVINGYLQVEKTRLPANLANVSFTPNKNEYFPIPQLEVNLNKKMIQNNGY